MIRKKLLLVSLMLISLLIILPASFAEDDINQNSDLSIVSDDSSINVQTQNNNNQIITSKSDNEVNILKDNGSEPIDIYFDASARTDRGNGSNDNPYMKLKRERILDNSIVHLAKGSYEFNSYKYIRNVTFIGQSEDNTFIYGANITNNGTLNIQHITFVNSGIENYNNLTIKNTIFTESYYNNILGADGTITIDNCTFSKNRYDHGGILYIENTTLNINNTNISNNQAVSGGAICSIKSTLNINNSLFANNNVSNMGGTMTLLNSTAYISNTTFKNNTAKYYGGSIYSIYGQLNISNSLFEYNNAKEGGALYLDNINNAILNSNIFSYNNATSYGVAYILKNKNNNLVTITDNTFNNNTAEYENEIYQTDKINLSISGGNYTLISSINTTIDDTIPSTYDLRDYGYVTPVKDQGTDGNCWSFSSLAALESCILKATNTSYDFSEANMKNLMGIYSDYGWNMTTNEGGYDSMALGYLTSWLGPINEKDDIYTCESVLSPVLNSLFHVQNIIYLERKNFTDNNAIKEAIMKYGAVSCGIGWYSQYTYRQTYYCYDNFLYKNHAVAIVGWDDNYSRFNFVTGAPANGAWIIKNSWGTTTGDNGYYYVSYYDKTIALGEYSYTFLLNDTLRLDNNYQYDIQGVTDYFYNNTTTVWYKNVFSAKSNEYLSAVSTYFNNKTNYEIKINVNNEEKIKQEGYTNPGYYTIDLIEKIELHKDDQFEVIIKINTENETGIPISENISLATTLYDKNISFISYDGQTWQDLYNLTWQYSTHNYFSQVASIKAFTVNTQAILDLTSNNKSPCEITARVHDQFNKSITDGQITFKLNSGNVTLNLTDGEAKIITTLPKGENNITATYLGDDYGENTQSIIINITTDSDIKQESIITLTQQTAGVNDTIIITAKITDNNYNNLSGGKVAFKINGKTLKDDNGKIIYASLKDGIAQIEYTIPDSWANRTLNLSAVYSGTGKILSSRNDTTLTVTSQETTIVITPFTEDVKINSTVTIKAKISNAENIKNAKIVFKLNGKTLKDDDGKVIYAHADENGGVSINYTLTNLKSRQYTLTATLVAGGYQKVDTETTISVIN